MLRSILPALAGSAKRLLLCVVALIAAQSLNFLVTKDFRLKVADLGLARTVSPSQSMATMSSARGTLVYCSPEGVRARVVCLRSLVFVSPLPHVIIVCSLSGRAL